MASAMSPELQILEMLEKDISVYSQVGPTIQKLGDELLKMYDELKQGENERLQRVSTISPIGVHGSVSVKATIVLHKDELL